MCACVSPIAYHKLAPWNSGEQRLWGFPAGVAVTVGKQPWEVGSETQAVGGGRGHGEGDLWCGGLSQSRPDPDSVPTRCQAPWCLQRKLELCPLLL